MKTELWDVVAKAYHYDSIKALLVEWYEVQGRSQEAIANELNTSRSTVTRLLQEHEIEVRVKATLEITREEAINLSVAQIARRHLVTKSTAWRAKRKALGEEDA
jgi:transposase